MSFLMQLEPKVAVVEHGEECDLGQSPPSPQPSFHCGQGDSKSEKEENQYKHLLWPVQTNPKVSPASRLIFQPLYCVWRDRVTVSLTDDSEHKTAKVAAAWNHIASIEIHNFVISTLADLRSRPSC